MIKENSIVRHNYNGRIYVVADTSHNGGTLYLQPLNCGGRSIGKLISKVSAADVVQLAQISIERENKVSRWQITTAGVFNGGGCCANKSAALNDATIFAASVFPC